MKVKPSSDELNKYDRRVPGTDIWLDVYDVLTMFEVNNPATAHAIKKLVMPGDRGAKDQLTDLGESIQAIERAIELVVPPSLSLPANLKVTTEAQSDAD